jgi:membrane protein CcdC involved in cytochrome C biogenesis
VTLGEVLVNFSLMATVLWAAGFIGNAALIFVLFYKRRYGLVPWFTAMIALGLVYTIALFAAYRFGSKHVYALVYWSSAFLDVLMQIAVVLEIAKYTLKRSGRWVPGSRLPLVLMGSTAPLVALAMAWFMKPAARTSLQAFEARSSLFTTILICLLFSAVVVASQQLGLGMQTHVMRESYGFMVWSLVAFVTDTLHAYWRTVGHFAALDHIRMVVYLATLVYWSVVFWLPEPTLLPISVDTKKRLNAFAARLQ